MKSSSSSSAAPLHGNHVWVREDLVEAILSNQGTLPAKWKPRKRHRYDNRWGWCRAVVNHTETPGGDPKFASPDFKSVQLRSVVASPGYRSPPLRGTPTKKEGKKVAITLTVEDDELAPLHVQNSTVSFTYSTVDESRVCAANAWWLTNDEPPADLTALEQLHEPAVVFCLQRRYEHDQVYTYTGKILLALNPFRVLENVYGPEVMETYWNNDYTERPPPHIYATAEDAYRSMMRDSNSPNQSILVSGESGAGKTVTTKIIMRYLATLSQRSSRSSHASIESQVLQSNPILESFGNARTMRNDNSSRFGKFIEIRFDQNGSLVSASVETYLLEKVRLISQAPGERNYHIFYEVLAALPEQYKRDMGISHASPEDFRLTASSGTYDRRDGVSDEDTFAELQTALNTVGFSEEEQLDLFTVVSGLLHTSNLDFVELASDSSALDENNPHLEAVAILLGFEPETLNDALCRCLIEAGGERLYKNLSKDRAEKAVEALIKATYGALFTHIVRRVNTSIAQSGGMASIAVLDIFGFESFEVNSLEQLCINYCNEALQQQFNRFVFTLEQQEYKKEGIDWSFIDFPDNQDVLDLIDKRHDGILSILDEQCRLSRCTDRSFALTVYDKCRSHPRFVLNKHHEAQLCFAISHYAGVVEYDTTGFIEKNKDELPKETTELLKSSSHPFIAQLGRMLCEESAPRPQVPKRGGPRTKVLNRSGSSIMRESVGIQFSGQLKDLRTRIESTSPHYVRCLKPNDDLIPHSFNHSVIADQLRCAGVLEAIRVSRVGFPHRYFHQHFCDRYGILAKSSPSRLKMSSAPADVCKALVNAIAPQLADFERAEGGSPSRSPRSKAGSSLVLGLQMGKTKVFLRLRAFEALEIMRNRTLARSVVMIQSTMRMYLARTRFTVAVYAAIVVQRFLRHVETYRIEQEQRIYNSARRIQNAWRCHLAQSHLMAAYCVAWWCQSSYRGSVARQLAAYMFLDKKACTLQRAWKHHQSSRTFRSIRRAVISVQTRYRVRCAFRQLCELRLEARDLVKVAAERDKLRKETERLRQQLEKEKHKPLPKIKARDPPREEKTAEVKLLRDQVARLKMELEKAHRMSPSKSQVGELQKLLGQVKSKEDQLQQLRGELTTLRSREDSFSLQSYSIHGSFYQDPNAFEDHYLNKTLSPVRSDVSLLDTVVNDNSEAAVVPDVDQVPSGLSNGTSDSGSPEELRHLHNAIRRKNYDLIAKVFLQTSNACVLVNEGDKDGRTAIHHACVSGEVGITSKLLDLGGIANAQDEDGETALHLAESVAMTVLLLEKGKANPNIPNIDGICALHLAVQRRDLESVRTLLASTTNVNNADNIRWFTALHLIALPARNETDDRSGSSARSSTRIRIAQLLSGSLGSAKADLNYQDREGNTPLHYAVQIPTAEACDIVGTFLEKGANPNISNERNQTPLHLLCHNIKLRELEVYQETLHTMLFHRADPNVQSLTGCTALHLSLYHRDISSAIQLVSRGAQLHILWKKVRRENSFDRKHVEGHANFINISRSAGRPSGIAKNRPKCSHWTW
jgi:myosin-5